MDTIIIRRPRTDEFDAVTRVWLDSHISTGLAVAGEASFDDLRARIPREIADGWQLYVAELDGVVAAMLAFRARDKYLDQLFVAPEHQGKGIGKALLAFARQHLPDEILLRTAAKNHRAIGWYEREGFVRENEVLEDGWPGPRVYYRWRAKDSWRDFHRRWSRLKPPLRANAQVTARIAEAIDSHRAHTLLLGVTPELAAIAERTTALDKSEGMIAQIWPGDDEKRHAVLGNWLAMPFEAAQFSSAIGDGSLNSIPMAEYPLLFAELARVLRPGARLAVRVYETPEPGETVAQMRGATMTGMGGGFHAFKWRLAMAIAAERHDPHVPLALIHQVFERKFPDRAALAHATGWTREDIDEIDAYAGTDSAYSFPTRAVLLAALPRSFANPRFADSGSYELAERCPILIADFAP